MAKGLVVLDMPGLSDKQRKEIVSVGGDPDFVEFVLAWHGVIRAERVPFTHDRPSQTIIRHTKRRLLRAWGSVHPKAWKEILFAWRERPKLMLHKTLFTVEPQSVTPPHRPRDTAKWTAVCDLRNYFKRVSGGPKMILIQESLGLGRAYGQFNPEWQRRKSWFGEIEATERLDKLRIYYQVNRDSIRDSLQTGIPLYERYTQKRAK